MSFTPHVAWATTDSPVVVRMDSGSRLDAPVGSFGMFSIERVNVGRIDRFPLPKQVWSA